MTQASLERTPAPAPVTNLVQGPRVRLLNWRRALLLLGPIVLLAGGATYYFRSGRYISTDDAYIKSRILSVTSDVAGKIVGVPVRDNQTVKKGDILIEIDPEPYRLKLEAAEADLGRVKQDAEALRATVRGRQQDLAEANADLDYSQREFDRDQPLAANGALARNIYDKALRDLDQARARVGSLDQQIRSSLAQLGGSLDTPTEHLPSYLSALAARDTAAYNLARATVTAPADGQLGAITIRPGEYVTQGQAVFPEIDRADTWIEANIRETDLTHLRDGQPATFTIDAYPGRAFQARVESFGPATGSELSVLPAENATGNWVKIVQRLALRLKPEFKPDDPPLRAGLSVNVEIDAGVYPNMPAFLARLLGSGPAQTQ